MARTALDARNTEIIEAAPLRPNDSSGRLEAMTAKLIGLTGLNGSALYPRDCGLFVSH